MTRIERIRKNLRDVGLIDLAKWFARFHSVTVDELLGDTHQREPVAARHAFWAALVFDHRLSHARIARLLLRHHTSVLQGVRNHVHINSTPASSSTATH